MTHDLKPRQGAYAFKYMTRQMRTPATLVGALAVHRKGGDPRSGWTVSHVATEAHAEKAMPPRFFGRAGTVTASKRELIAWAIAWQEAAPEFFKAMADLPVGTVHHDRTGTLELAQTAVDAGRAL